MALIAISIEMSFSLSRLRRTLRSMSIRAPPVPGPGPGCRRPAVSTGVFPWPRELHLHPARAKFGVGKAAVLAIDIQRDAVVISHDHTAAEGRRWRGSIRLGGRNPRLLRGQGNGHQTATGTAPMTRFGERAVHPRGRHLQGVGSLPHRP